jgi:Xaa-Pro aminopeptidase
MANELPFTMEEYQRRLKQVRKRMAARDLDTLLVVNPASCNYLTGYVTFAVGAYQCLVVPREGDLSLLTFELELPGVFLSSWIEDGAAYVAGEDPLQATRRLLERRGLTRGTIGIERDSNFMPVERYERLVASLDGCRLADGSRIVAETMHTKSPVEIEMIRQAGKITAQGMSAAIGAVRAGVTDNDVAAAAYAAMIAAGSEFMCIDPIVTTGMRSGVPHTTHRRVRIEPGDPVWIELGACYQRYSAPLMRTVFVGEPSREVQALADASLAALRTVMSTVRPGITAEAVAAEGRKALPLDDSSVVFHHTYGYSIGLGLPAEWSDDMLLRLREGNTTVLEPGMVFHATMGLRRRDRYGAVCSETIAVTDTGCEALTDFPRKYFYC